MNDRHARNWSATFLGVVVVEALVLLSLWLFSRHFSS